MISNLELINCDKCEYINYYNNDNVITICNNNRIINNNLKLNITEVKIYNGFGIILFNNNIIIKIIKNTSMKIEFDLTNKEIKVYLFIPILIQFEQIPTLILNFDKENLFENNDINNSNKFSIGDIVFPKNIMLYDIKEKYNIPIAKYIFDFLNNKYIIKNKKEEEIDEKLLLNKDIFLNNNIINESSFTIKNICNNLYKIERNNIIYYSEEKDLYSLEEIQNQVYNFYNKKECH